MPFDIIQDKFRKFVNRIRILSLVKRMGIRRLKDDSFREVYSAKNPHNMRSNTYVFSYRLKQSSMGVKSWYAYILAMPNLDGQDPSMHRTHRVADEVGRYFISWCEPVQSLKNMQSIAHTWADMLQEYIATGK